MAGRRKPGEGSIRQRRDGRWEGRVVIGYDENNLPKTKNVLAKTKRECEEKLEALKESLGKRVPDITPGMPFGDWIDRWYRIFCQPSLRDNTRGAYENHIYKHVIPALGATPLNKLTQTALEDFYAELKNGGRLIRRELYGDGLSDRSVRACHACIRAALEKAVELNLLPVSPAKECRLPHKREREARVLSPAEMQRLLIQAQTEGFYELFLLDLSTGLRRGELLGLRWEDVNFDTGALTIHRQVRFVKGELTISPPKTDAAHRTILLPPPLIEVLRAYRQTVNSAWLFPSPVKTEDVPRDPTAVRKRLSQIIERAGCKHVRFHDLRHTFATMSLGYGMDIKTLASTLGHASAETTLNIYSHVTDEMRRSAAEKIDRAMGGPDTDVRPVEAPSPQKKPFTAQPGKIRRRGTGCVSRISDTTWEGRYSPRLPDGSRDQHVIYAHSEEECERMLAEMIQEVKEQRAAQKLGG